MHRSVPRGFFVYGKIVNMKKEIIMTKKVSPPRSKKATKPNLVMATGAQAFWVHNGPVLRTLVDLKRFLETTTLDQFFYHTKRSGASNDFANWVRVVLSDEKCAEALSKADTPKKSVTVIARALRAYRL